jgi:hypothetical protein
VRLCVVNAAECPNGTGVSLTERVRKLHE